MKIKWNSESCGLFVAYDIEISQNLVKIHVTYDLKNRIISPFVEHRET